jgi:alcohol dehydrogenase class IV
MLKSPNLILAGFGALEKMGEEAGNLEAKKALLVTIRALPPRESVRRLKRC